MKKRGGRCVSRVGGVRAGMSVFARCSGEVCAEGGVCGGRGAYVEGVCEGFAVSHTCVSSSASFIWKCLR